MKGTYVLIIQVDKVADIAVGKRRRYHFQPGYYAYVGSALSGLQARVRRHLSPEKKCHWHIDYLLREGSIQDVVYAETDEKKECNLAQWLSGELPAAEGFGCSDCRCQSHLFFSPERQSVENLVTDAFLSLDLNAFNLHGASLLEGWVAPLDEKCGDILAPIMPVTLT